MERGTPGERYLVGAYNWTFAEFLGRLERLTKVPGPMLKARGKLPLLATRAQAAMYRAGGLRAQFAVVNGGPGIISVINGRVTGVLAFTVADGLIVEVHPAPENALCDGPQALHAETFGAWVADVQRCVDLMGRVISGDDAQVAVGA